MRNGFFGASHLLEIANGVWAIVSLFLTAFLAYHIAKVGRLRGVNWAAWSKIPQSLQLAVAMLAISFGVLITSADVWWARHSNGGPLDLGALDTFWFLAGRLIAIVGFLCALRVVTRPMLGHWPWVSALLLCVGYLAWSAIGQL